jgi:hypothetical protein
MAILASLCHAHSILSSTGSRHQHLDDQFTHDWFSFCSYHFSTTLRIVYNHGKWGKVQPGLWVVGESPNRFRFTVWSDVCNYGLKMQGYKSEAVVSCDRYLSQKQEARLKEAYQEEMGEGTGETRQDGR